MQEGSHSEVGDSGWYWWTTSQHRSLGNLAPLEDELTLVGTARQGDV